MKATAILTLLLTCAWCLMLSPFSLAYRLKLRMTISQIQTVQSQPRWHTFDYKGNQIKCNEDINNLKATFVMENLFAFVNVRYNDGKWKTFTIDKWRTFGPSICKHCPKIKVVVK